MLREKYVRLVRQHYEAFWKTPGAPLTFDHGPIYKIPDQFVVLRFPPSGDRAMWTYATCGMSFAADKDPIETHLFARQPEEHLVELLSMVASYHRTGETLGLGHTVPIGRPWFDKSHCDHLLISLPYLDGPDLEWLTIGDLRIRSLWAIPITKAEREYKKKNGLEALEQLFEAQQFDYLDPLRLSVT